MFPLQLLLGGNPLSGAASGLACCTVVATSLYAMRKKIPHPSEFALIGFCCLHGGCHKHEKFNLIVEIHEAANIPKGPPVYLYLECGRFEAESSKNPVDSKTREAGIFERLNLHIRQMDNILKVSLWRKGGITSTKLGELEIDIVQEIMEKNFPQQEWYHLKLNDKLTVKVKLSFYRLSAAVKQGTSPLVEYALIKAARDQEQTGGGAEAAEPLDFESLSEKEQLRFLSSILEGPLQVLTSMGWKNYYYKPVERHEDKWRWCFWKTKEDMLKGCKASGGIPFLSISLILPDKHNRHIFYVKYHKKTGVQDIFFSRVDRDRNLWSDGLYEFILRLRGYLESRPLTLKSEKLVRKTSKSSKAREKVLLDSKLRTVLGPAQRRDLKTMDSQVINKPKQPQSLLAMVEEAMEGYYPEDDQDSESTGDHVNLLPRKTDMEPSVDDMLSTNDFRKSYQSSTEFSSDAHNKRLADRETTLMP